MIDGQPVAVTISAANARGCGPVGIHIGDDDACAFRRKAAGNGRPDAACRPRDDDRLVLTRILSPLAQMAAAIHIQHRAVQRKPTRAEQKGGQFPDLLRFGHPPDGKARQRRRRALLGDEGLDHLCPHPAPGPGPGP